MRLTNRLLRRIIEEEVAKFGDMQDVEKVKADETDADEYADALEKKIDYMKALKVEESRLRRRIAKINETRRRLTRGL
ncbi:MAG: hypothetical protein EBR82_00680 [Caulobacteraceae bacterium]|jgi:hypothetical protein|nr:hypothetical protein [Caulobacteraceae bacterium]